MKSSEYSNGTKGKINNRTCTCTTWKWEIYLHEIMSLTQTWSRSGLSRPVRLVQQILPTELTLSISAMSNITNWEQSFLTTAYNKSKNIPFINIHTRLMAPFPGLFGWASTRKVKQSGFYWSEIVSGISWAICKSAPRSWQITMPAPHHSVFYRPDALPTAQRQGTEGKGIYKH